MVSRHELCHREMLVCSFGSLWGVLQCPPALPERSFDVPCQGMIHAPDPLSSRLRNLFPWLIRIHVLSFWDTPGSSHLYLKSFCLSQSCFASLSLAFFPHPSWSSFIPPNFPTSWFQLPATHPSSFYFCFNFFCDHLSFSAEVCDYLQI